MNLVEIITLKNKAAALYLNRPEKRNALSVSLLKAIISAIKNLDSSIRTLYILGKGDDFCTGLDLKEKNPIPSELIAETFLTIEEAPQVTIACIQGRAMGGGAGLALASDFILMEEGSSFAFPEVKRGLIPALVATLLMRKVHESTLKNLLLLSEPLVAIDAVKLELAMQVVKKEDLLIEADKIAVKVGSTGPLAIKETKALIGALYGREQAYSLAAKAHSKARLSSEAKEGINAFLEKRDPIWQPL